MRECLGRVVYTHKAHEKFADNYAATLRRLKTSEIVLSTATAFGAVIVAAFDPELPLAESN
ncbi:hypothetical protein ACIQUS_20650 [Pseudomonas sp. NPDC090755]|uniref:hypothetical protein n=1 Tax=Pseudomonas sp. NPDC090755 TaxID=3364481 RepID=UPI003839D91F